MRIHQRVIQRGVGVTRSESPLASTRPQNKESPRTIESALTPLGEGLEIRSRHELASPREFTVFFIAPGQVPSRFQRTRRYARFSRLRGRWARANVRGLFQYTSTAWSDNRHARGASDWSNESVRI